MYDKKWIKFLKRTWLFRYIPFVDFALAAGSMATGNVKPDSDFDVIVGARAGRIFTARFFSVLVFGIFGWRRRKMHLAPQTNADSTQTNAEISAVSVSSQRDSASDKVCLNHFVTEKSYRLSGPYNAYWQRLYQNLVPLFGEPEKINDFFAANADWVLETKDIARPRVLRCRYIDDLRHCYHRKAWIAKIAERFLLCDWIEKFLRRIQISKIEQSLKSDKPGFEPRIKYNDDELEFHPDTKRIEDFLRRR